MNQCVKVVRDVIFKYGGLGHMHQYDKFSNICSTLRCRKYLGLP